MNALENAVETMTNRYTFSKMTTADLPMVGKWLAEPFVTKWWGDPQKELADIADELDNDSIREWIVSHAGAPIAYIQDYDVHAWPEPHVENLPKDAIGIDVFVGVEAIAGKGHGSAFIREHALRLKASGASTIIIDPAPTNLRARRAYEKAGFRGDKEHVSSEGPIILMFFEG